MVCVLQVLAKRFGTEIAFNALENGTYRQEAIAALGVVGDKSAAQRLLLILQSQEEEDDIRREAALALGNIGDNRAVKPLVETLDNWSLREQAATALGNIGDRSAVDALIVALQEYGPDNVWFLKSAAEALGRIGDTRALVPLLRSDLRWYGAEVRQVFREFGRTAIDPLISILKTGDAYLQHQAAQALEFITDENFGPDPVAWQKWWDKNR
jgi:HEAT repeat protein